MRDGQLQVSLDDQRGSGETGVDSQEIEGAEMNVTRPKKRKR
jgi:hypothetical protein